MCPCDNDVGGVVAIPAIRRLWIYVALLVAMTVKAAGAEPPIVIPPDLAAAMLIAYDDYVSATKSNSVPFRPKEVLKLESVSVRREGDKAVVRFKPPSAEFATGGSIVYVIRLPGLNIEQRVFGR